MDEPISAPDRTTLTAFAGAVVFGGMNFLAVKFSNEELDPLYGAGLRFAAAAALLFLLARIMRWPLPRGRAAFGAALYGLFGFGISYAGLYYALVGLTPGLASIVVATVPLFTLALAVLQGQEKFTRQGIVGGVLAIAGIGVLSLRSISGDIQPIYFLYGIGGVLAIAESSVIVKGFPRAHPFTTNAVGMAAGAALLLPASLLLREEWVVPVAGKTWLALAWLVPVGSIALFALYLFVIGRWTASATNYAVTMMPIVAVTAGVLFADEELTVELLGGGALVMAAVYVGALYRGKRVERAPAVVTSEPAPEAASGA